MKHHVHEENGFKFLIGYKKGEHVREYNPWYPKNDIRSLGRIIWVVERSCPCATIASMLWLRNPNGGTTNNLEYRVLPCDEKGNLIEEAKAVVAYNEIMRFDKHLRD